MPVVVLLVAVVARKENAGIINLPESGGLFVLFY